MAGEEDGARVFIGIRAEPVEGADEARLHATEYVDLRPVRSFVVKVPAYLPVIRQAELDATGRFWVLVIEEPPPPLAPYRRPRLSLWLVSRSGRQWVKVRNLGKRGPLFLATFADAGDSIVTWLSDTVPPEASTFALAGG